MGTLSGRMPSKKHICIARLVSNRYESIRNRRSTLLIHVYGMVMEVDSREVLIERDVIPNVVVAVETQNSFFVFEVGNYQPFGHMGYSRTIPKKGYSLELYRMGSGANFYKTKAMLISRVTHVSTIVEGNQGLYAIYTEDGYRYVIKVIGM